MTRSSTPQLYLCRPTSQRALGHTAASAHHFDVAHRVADLAPTVTRRFATLLTSWLPRTTTAIFNINNIAGNGFFGPRSGESRNNFAHHESIVRGAADLVLAYERGRWQLDQSFFQWALEADSSNRRAAFDAFNRFAAKRRGRLAGSTKPRTPAVLREHQRAPAS